MKHDRQGILILGDRLVSTAFFSDDGLYRYFLMRHWSDGPTVNFIMLNPSTADDVQNDPTVSRCIRRAREQLGCGRLIVTNLFALISTDSDGLLRAENPVGAHNDSWIMRGARPADLIVAAWGSHDMVPDRAGHVCEMLAAMGKTVHALRVNADGEPGHPLYLPYALEPVEYCRSEVEKSLENQYPALPL